MNLLYLVKSDTVKCRYFFTDEAKATALYKELLSQSSDVVLKYLKTSDEWTVEQLTNNFRQAKELL